jgi:hypothetical protein
MTSRHMVRPLAPIALEALLACLAFTTESQAQKGHRNPAQEAKQVINQQMNFNEAEVLREAYVLLAAANSNYQGHCGKAMNHIQEAVRLLDVKVLTKGTAAQKAATLLEDSAAARAKIIAKYAPGIHEPQALSNALVLKSGELMASVIPVLKERNQKGVLGHVHNAEKEIANALKAR